MKKTLLFSLVLSLFLFGACSKEEEEKEKTVIETIECPSDPFKDRYVNNSNLADSTVFYWNETHKLDDIDFVYTQDGDYRILFKNADIELEIFFKPPTVKGCSHILQTESTLPYATKLSSGYRTRIAFVLWDKKHYMSSTACQTSDNDEKYGYAKLTANESSFNLSFENIQVRSQMFWEEPYQSVSMNLTLPYDCSVECPQ